MPQEKTMSAPPEKAAEDPAKNTPASAAEKTAENMPKKTPGKKRLVRRIVLIALLILLVTIPTVLFVLASGDRQTGFPRPVITPEDWDRQSRLTMTAMQQVLDQNNTGEFASITLTPADVNTLLRFAINRDQFASLFGRRKTFDETVPWAGKYDTKGIFHLAYILRGPGSISFTLRGSVSGRYGNNRFELEPGECRIGRLPVPKWAIRRILPRILARLNRQKHIRLFHQTVESVLPDQEHNLIVTFRPDQARSLHRQGL